MNADDYFKCTVEVASRLAAALIQSGHLAGLPPQETPERAVELYQRLVRHIEDTGSLVP